MNDIYDTSFERKVIELRMKGDPVDLAIFLYENDHTMSQIARRLGVTYATVYRWTHPHYAESVRRANRERERDRRTNAV